MTLLCLAPFLTMHPPCKGSHFNYSKGWVPETLQQDLGMVRWTVPEGSVGRP